jgi:hypothetical protein
MTIVCDKTEKLLSVCLDDRLALPNNNNLQQNMSLGHLIKLEVFLEKTSITHA